ncbi:MAG: signal transduction histidine kinase [Cyclobacteriaceae bacterium]|jgi:signal transduction histidine kinase
MRLIQKFILVYLVISLIAFGIGGVVVYRIFSNEIDRETNYELRRDVEDLKHLIEKGVGLDALLKPHVTIKNELKKKIPSDSTVFSDTLAYHRYSHDTIRQRKIEAYRTINDSTYRFSIYGTIIEPEDTQNSATRSMVILFLVLVAFSLLLSFFVSKWLLSAFHVSLTEMKNFNLQDSEPIELPNSSTYEFKNLNKFINQMTTKAIKDYRNLKEFSENLSHEVSTPLAVASGRLDLLLQENKLPEHQIGHVISAQNAILKLSKIQRALSLITKIENSEFSEVTEYDLSENLNKLIEESQELVELKGIKMTSEIENDIEVKMDATLAEILFSNLYQNAIKHNIEKGTIKIILTKKSFIIENSGEPPKSSPSFFFERFKKNNQSSESLGLGLSIVKKICDISNLSISYKFDEKTGLHEIEIAL